MMDSIILGVRFKFNFIIFVVVQKDKSIRLVSNAVHWPANS